MQLRWGIHGLHATLRSLRDGTEARDFTLAFNSGNHHAPCARIHVLMRRRGFKYRVYPTKQQDVALNSQVDEACRLYNAALDERKSAWRMRHVRIGYLDQARQLKEIRDAGNVGIANFSMCQDVLRRLDKAFSRFFGGLVSGKRVGFPRFRSHSRYSSITWPSWGDGCSLRGNGRLYLQGVGELKVRWHRVLPAQSQIKSVTVVRQAGHWYVCFNLELPDALPLPPNDIAVGIDLGLELFAVTSNGIQIDNPRHLRAAERRLRAAHRKLSRRKQRSRRRQKARQQFASLHVHVRNQRRDFHHKTALVLIRDFGRIAVEDLNVSGLASSRISKSVNDAGWSQFLRILTVKAEEAGRLLVAVNPAGTSQRCSCCGAYVPKDLRQRLHFCASCGLRIGRDENAARNVLHLAEGSGWGLQARTVEDARAVA
jgi:putative transposase